MKLAADHYHLVSKLKMRGAIPPTTGIFTLCKWKSREEVTPVCLSVTSVDE